jgi:antitoxin component of RelBE/YafQ-DinJ toxin-antitoxin module
VREQAASMGISVSQAISLALLAVYKGERHPILPQ